jgi:hypothetical protein
LLVRYPREIRGVHAARVGNQNASGGSKDFFQTLALGRETRGFGHGTIVTRTPSSKAEMETP